MGYNQERGYVISMLFRLSIVTLEFWMYPKVYEAFRSYEKTIRVGKQNFFPRRDFSNRKNYGRNILRRTEQRHVKVCKRYKVRIHMYPVKHTPLRSRNWCRLILDLPKAFRARILIGLNTMDSRIRCECTKLTRGVAKAARTRETLDFLGRPASQTSEVQDGSRQPATNFKNLDRKPSVPYRQKNSSCTQHGHSTVYILLEERLVWLWPITANGTSRFFTGSANQKFLF